MSRLITNVKGYGAAMLNILYRRPDELWLYQEYIWHDRDHCPDFPEAKQFLRHWYKNLDGPLVAVTLDHSLLKRPIPIFSIDGEVLCSPVVPILKPLIH